MSKGTEKEEVQRNILKDTLSILNKHKIPIIASGLALCVGIGIGIWSVKKNVPADVNATVRVTGAEKNEAIESINSLIAEMKENNCYIKLIDGEDSSQTYIYNKKGESVAQGSLNNYLTVFTNDNKGVRYTDTIEKGEDIDILSIVTNTVQLAKDGKAVMTKPETIIEGDEKGFKSYNIELKGWDTIEKIYEPISKEFADKMISNMKEQAQNVSDIELTLQIIVGNEKQLSVACQLNMNNQKYMLWYFDGYLLLYDWELAEEWYSYDFSDEEKSEQMLDSLLTSLDEMFKRYADDNDLPQPGEEVEKHTADDGHNHTEEELAELNESDTEN